MALFDKYVLVAKWIRRWFPEPKIEGSSPFKDVVKRIYGLVGYDVCLTRRRSPVRSWVDVFLARCSPRGVMETRLPPKEKIVGSSPTGGVPKVLWCNWLALRTLNPAIRVQVPVGPFIWETNKVHPVESPWPSG